jgi:hypothetical protein
MNKLEELHFPHSKTWDCYNDEPLEENHALKSAKITEQIAIEFGKFISSHRLDFQSSINSKFIGLDMKNYSSEELFQEFLKQYYNDTYGKQ